MFMSLRCQKNLLPQFWNNLWLSIFHVKNNAKLLLDWMDFLFKNDTHVSFPDKNLRNFSLSLSLSMSKNQAAAMTTTTKNFTKSRNCQRIFHSKFCHPRFVRTKRRWIFFLKMVYIPWLQFGFRIGRLECERFPSSWINFT